MCHLMITEKVSWKSFPRILPQRILSLLYLTVDNIGLGEHGDKAHGDKAWDTGWTWILKAV